MLGPDAPPKKIDPCACACVEDDPGPVEADDAIAEEEFAPAAPPFAPRPPPLAPYVDEGVLDEICIDDPPAYAAPEAEKGIPE